MQQQSHNNLFLHGLSGQYLAHKLQLQSATPHRSDWLLTKGHTTLIRYKSLLLTLIANAPTYSLIPERRKSWWSLNLVVQTLKV